MLWRLGTTVVNVASVPGSLVTTSAWLPVPGLTATLTVPANGANRPRLVMAAFAVSWQEDGLWFATRLKVDGAYPKHTTCRWESDTASTTNTFPDCSVLWTGMLG